MALPKPLTALFGVLLVLAVVVFVPATNPVILFTPSITVPALALEYGLPGFPAAERYDAATRLDLAQETARWLGSPAGIDGLAALRHDGQPVYNERELSHMADVKVVLEGVRWAWRVAGLILVGMLVLAVWQPAWRRPFARGTFWGSALLVALLIGILLIVFFSFDWFFVRFHQVFFAGGTWMFDYQDSLIQFFPEPLWIAFFVSCGASTLVEGVLLGGLALAYTTRGQKRR